MSFQVRHDWIGGKTVLKSKLATCAHCKTLRVHRLDDGGFHYVRRLGTPDRITVDEPPCIAPSVRGSLDS